MARGKKSEFTEKDRDEIRKLATIGVKVDDIGLIKGYSHDTLQRHCALELKEGKAAGKTKVIHTAYTLATSGKCPAMTMFWLKTQDRWREVEKGEDTPPPPSKKIALGTIDPIEAAKIYQKIMGEEIKSNESDSNNKA